MDIQNDLSVRQLPTLIQVASAKPKAGPHEWRQERHVTVGLAAAELTGSCTRSMKHIGNRWTARLSASKSDTDFAEPSRSSAFSKGRRAFNTSAKLSG